MTADSFDEALAAVRAEHQRLEGELNARKANERSALEAVETRRVALAARHAKSTAALESVLARIEPLERNAASELSLAKKLRKTTHVALRGLLAMFAFVGLLMVPLTWDAGAIWAALGVEVVTLWWLADLGDREALRG